MQFKRATAQFVREDDDPVRADLDRTAAVITLVGCGFLILGFIVPWVAKVASADSSTGTVVQPTFILLVPSVGISGHRLDCAPPATGHNYHRNLAYGVGGDTAWPGDMDGVSIMRSLHQVESHLVLISAIGTGAYLGMMGSVITLAGGVVAWTTRRRE